MIHAQKQHAVRRRPLKLSTLVSLMFAAVIATVLLSVNFLYYIQVDNFIRAHLNDKALAVARTLADSPEIQHALTLSPTDNIIQPIANTVVKRNDLLFAVIINMQGIRYSHPNPQFINHHFIGDDFLPSLRGLENLSVNHGVLDEALRVFTPVYNAQHQQVGVVAIGISMSEVNAQINRNRWNIFWTVLVGALVGSIGMLILVTRLKRILFGLEPYEISSLFEQRQAILESTKEGVIAVDEHARVTLINQAARTLLRETTTEAPLTGESIPENSLILSHLRDALHNGTAWLDEKVSTRGRTLISNTVPVRSGQRIIGAVCTFRDKTEISQLMQRLDGMVNYVDILSERSHEFMNKLHVILGLLHLKNYPQAEAFILQSANSYQNEIGTLQQKIGSPMVAGFVLSKINRAAEKGYQLTLSDASSLPNIGSEQQVGVLITVLGNLIENALEAFAEQPDGEIDLLLHYQNGWLACEVGDDGPGIAADFLPHIFDKGLSSKGNDRGVGLFLVHQQVRNLGGQIAVESEPGVYTQFLVQLPWGKGNNSV